MIKEDDEEEKDLSTCVDGLEADDNYRGSPVFDVTNKEFFSNMRKDRNRIRFSSEKPKQFMQGTKYRVPFMVRYTDKNNGKQYLSKIK